MTALLERTASTPEAWRDGMAALYRAGCAMLEAGQRPKASLSEDEDGLSIRQLRFIHGPILQQISEQVAPGGVRFTKDAWKQHLKDLFIPDEWEMVHAPFVRDMKSGEWRPAKRKVPRKKAKSLTSLTGKRRSEFIDQVLAHAATEWGVEFVFRFGEREAVKRNAPMKRGQGLKPRQTALRAKAPAKTEIPLHRMRKCPVKKGGCGGMFRPLRDKQLSCLECAVPVGKWLAADKAKRVQRDADAERRERLKRISDLESECRDIVQKIARIRDRHDGCISCHMGPNYSGVWHGSHYRAHGGCSSLQFHLWNIHKACAQCNVFKGGNKDGYIAGLLAKPGYGRERLDWLDSQPKSQRFEREYLLRFKRVMGKRCRRLERAAR